MPYTGPICGARTHGNGEPCRRPAGWGTDHPGRGRCKLHGGASHGPKDPTKLRGNRNGEKTGEHSAIWYDQLSDEEKALFHCLELDVLPQVDEELRLITIRERRMLERINSFKDKTFTTVEKIEKTGGEDGPTTEEKQHAVLGQVQAIEEALTRVQEKKTKLLELKAKIQEAQGPDDNNYESLIEIIKESTRVVGALVENRMGPVQP